MSLNRNLTKALVTKRVMNSQAAGATNVTSSSVDTQGYAAVRFVACLGALTATQVTKLKVQESDDDSTYTDVTGAETTAMADADGNKMLIADIYKPRKRYLKAVVERSTANAVIDSVVAELSLPDYQPVTADSTVSAQVILDNPV